MWVILQQTSFLNKHKEGSIWTLDKKMNALQFVELQKLYICWKLFFNLRLKQSCIFYECQMEH